jgi:amidase
VEQAAPAVPWEPFLDTLVVIWSAGITQLIDLVARFTNRTPSPDNLEAATWKLYQLGRTLTAIEWLDAMAFCNLISRSTGPFFASFDGLITPTLAREPIRIGECNQNGDWPDVKSYFRHAFNFAPFTPLYNVTGQPAMSVPLSVSPDGLPVGVQVVARFGDESLLLSLAAQLEEAKPWTEKRPPIYAGTSRAV